MTQRKPVFLALILLFSAMPAAKAAPLLDIGIGGGLMMLGDGPAGALSAEAHIPLGLLLGAQATVTQTVIQGNFDGRDGGIDYSGNLLGAFATLTTPSPGIKFRGKLGLTRSNLDLEGSDSDSSSVEPAFGAALLFGNWQLDFTRTRIDDRALDEAVHYLSFHYIW